MNTLDFFIGGVDPFHTWATEMDDLRALITNETISPDARYEVGLLVLVPRFEAFCRGLLAAAGNICPALFERQREPETLGGDLPGFPWAERLDLVSPVSVNVVFEELLGVEVFGENDLEQLRRLYADWGLLAHHGGVFTEAYRAARPDMAIAPEEVYRQSLVVSWEEFEEWVAFLDGLVRRMTGIVHDVLEERVDWDTVEMAEVRREALWFLSSEAMDR